MKINQEPLEEKKVLERICKSHNFNEERIQLLSQDFKDCFIEKVNLEDSPLFLAYSSDRSKDSSYLDLRLTGPKVPRSLRKVVLKITIEGRVLEHVLESEKNLNFTFEWDRKDVYGQFVQSRVANFQKM